MAEIKKSDPIGPSQPITAAEAPEVRSISAHPVRKRASALFWVLLVLLLIVVGGVIALGTNFSGY